MSVSSFLIAGREVLGNIYACQWVEKYQNLELQSRDIKY